jgi:hypothetical protein
MNGAQLRHPAPQRRRVPRSELASGATGAREPFDQVIDLQAAAGNRALASILGGPIAQRQVAGWSDADKRGKGWNVKPQDVDKIRRVPIEGLKLGGTATFVGDESQKTTERADHRAIVLIPAGLDASKNVDVMLHFHGWTHREDDPHAGWRQHSGPDATVRDVDQDRIEAQLQASGAKLIAILPQGVSTSEFGQVPVEPYIKEVLGRVAAANELRDAGGQVLTDAPALGRLVLSGHSGGGNRIMDMLNPATSKAPAEVILFEALHVTQKLDAPLVVATWAISHLDRVRKVLAGQPPPAERAAAVNAVPKLRAYYSDFSGGTFDPKRKREGYETNYERLKKLLDDWFGKYGPDLGPDLAAVRARFKVQPLTGTRHETVVRGLGDDPFAGPLTDALTALDDPTATSKLVTSGTTTWTKPRRNPKP